MTIEVVEETVDAEIVRTHTEWAEVIKSDLGRAVEGIVSAGKHLTAAKADLNHGEWLPMLKEIGIDQATARMLMQIGRNPAISNRCNSNDFPTAMRSLYELSRMEPEDIEDGIESGAISPSMKIKDAKAFASSDAPKHERESMLLTLINDMRGPWRKGITHAAKDMTDTQRGYIVEALENTLNEIKEMQK